MRGTNPGTPLESVKSRNVVGETDSRGARGFAPRTIVLNKPHIFRYERNHMMLIEKSETVFGLNIIAEQDAAEMESGHNCGGRITGTKCSVEQLKTLFDPDDP